MYVIPRTVANSTQLREFGNFVVTAVCCMRDDKSAAISRFYLFKAFYFISMNAIKITLQLAIFN